MTSLPAIVLIIASLLLGASAIVYRRRNEPEEPFDRFLAWLMGAFFLAILVVLVVLGIASIVSWAVNGLSAS